MMRRRSKVGLVVLVVLIGMALVIGVIGVAYLIERVMYEGVG